MRGMELGIKKKLLDELIGQLSGMKDPLDGEEEKEDSEELSMKSDNKPKAEVEIVKIEAKPKEEGEENVQSEEEESSEEDEEELLKKKLKHQMSLGY